MSTTSSTLNYKKNSLSSNKLDHKSRLIGSTLTTFLNRSHKIFTISWHSSYMPNPKVAVMNTSKEITEILQETLEMEGFLTCSTYTYLLKENEKRFDKFITENKPAVIVFDIALPYEDNYALFVRLSQRKAAEDIGFVLTTTNKKALELLVGQKTGAYEIIGKPYDLMQIVTAVKTAIKNYEGKSPITAA